MSDMRIDELNIRSMPYEEFFGEMRISVGKKKRLIEMAEDFEEDYIAFIFWMERLIDRRNTDYLSVKNRFAKTWGDTASKYLFDEDFILDYTVMFANDAVDSTLRNAGDEWFFSEDRAKFNAENEALTVFNRGEYLDAIENGHTKKKWISIMDGRERKTHRIADGQEVGIFDFFHVGKARMQYPRDIQNARMHPREYIGCRCFLEYS